MSYEEICQYVFREEKVSWVIHASKRRDINLVTARHISVFLGNQFLPELTWVELAKVFDKTHVTAIHSVNCVNNRMDTEEKFKEKVFKYSADIGSKIERSKELSEIKRITLGYSLIENSITDVLAKMRIIALSYCQLTNQKIVPNEQN